MTIGLKSNGGKDFKSDKFATKYLQRCIFTTHSAPNLRTMTQRYQTQQRLLNQIKQQSFHDWRKEIGQGAKR